VGLNVREKSKVLLDEGVSVMSMVVGHLLRSTEIRVRIEGKETCIIDLKRCLDYIIVFFQICFICGGVQVLGLQQ
jgi:hypothetical protein